MREEDKKITEAAEKVKAKPSQKKKHGKKKKRTGVPVALTAILIAIVLLFGVVAGYGFGRRNSAKRLSDAESKLDELTEAYEESERNDDFFDAATNLENEAALSDLAGEDAETEGNDLLGGDTLSEEDWSNDAEPVVVAEFEGGSIKSDEVGRAYEEQLASYVFEGYTEEEVSGDLLNEVLRELVTNKILRAQAEAVGIGEPSAEDESEIRRLAQENYDEAVRTMEDVTREEGMTDDAAYTAAARALDEEEGVTFETTLASYRENWWMERLYDETVKDVTVTDAEIEADYDARVAAQKEAFEANAEDYEAAQMSGDLIVYNLPNRRAVSEMLIAFDGDALDAVFELEESGSADAQAKVEEYYAALEEKAQAALAELKSGTAFEDVRKKYDPESDGVSVAVAADSIFWPQNLVEAAMALENAGDVSEPLRVENGVVILYYAGDVTPGMVPLNAVKESIRAELLDTAQYEAYSERVRDWIQKANVKYYPERMQ